MMRIYLLLHLLFILFWRVTSLCDTSITELVNEGNLAQSDMFSWLGVLKVHLHDGEKKGVAVTGVVLIKQRHALVNADDVAKIPYSIFYEDTRVMFMAAADVPWYCTPKSYITHPEYSTSTTSTIAILELNLDNTEYYPMRPICWSGLTVLNTTKQLFVAGYTDENSFLEKAIYEIHYNDKSICEEFYDRAGLTDTYNFPAHYLCVSSTKNRSQCVWDNGMLLITNVTRFFSLIGFGVRGPGCAAPARFIDLQYYREWIHDAVDKEDQYYDEYRRSNEPEDIPLHEMFKVNNSQRRNVHTSLPMPYQLYPFEVHEPKHFNVIEQNNHSLVILPFNETMEFYNNSCDDVKTLLYREDLELKSTNGIYGHAFYRISLYDLTKNPCTCAYLTIDSEWRSEATISYNEFIDMGEGRSVTADEGTPEEILKEILIEDRTVEPDDSEPKKHLKPSYLRYLGNKLHVLSYDLYFRFNFYHQASMKLEMYAVVSHHKAKRRLMPSDVTMKKQDSDLYQRRSELSKLPRRKMWYSKFPDTSKLKSGFIDEVPDTVNKAFTDRDDISITADDISIKSETSSSITDVTTNVNTVNSVSIKDYSHLLRFSTKSPKLLLTRPSYSLLDVFYGLPLPYKSNGISEELKSSVEAFDHVSSISSNSVSLFPINIIKMLYLDFFFFLLTT